MAEELKQLFSNDKAQELIDAIKQTDKVDKKQGISNAGKVLKVGLDGNVITDDVFTSSFKSALLRILRNVTYTSDKASEYYDLLESALNGTPTIDPLDEIVYNNLSYRDIFEDGNIFTIGKFDQLYPLSSEFTELSNGDMYKINAGTVEITDSDKYSGKYSIYETGTSSSQILYQRITPVSAPRVLKLFGAAAVKVIRYGGGNVGLQANLRLMYNGSSASSENQIAFTAVKNVVTDDYEIIHNIGSYDMNSADFEWDSIRLQLYAGSFRSGNISGNADAYIDNVFFGYIPNDMDENTATRLYTEYVNILRNR